MLATGIAMRYGVVYAHYQKAGLAFKVSGLDFALLMLALMLLAGAGNVINDYFDVRVDRINKPDKVVVGRSVKRRVAMVTHHGLNAISFSICVYLAWKQGIWYFALATIPVSLALWFYSFWFKRLPFFGNLVVAIFVGGVPFWSVLFELFPWETDIYSPYFMPVIESFSWVSVFSVFAFLLTLQREMQKDVQDLRGDKAGGYKTLPIVWGIRKTKKAIVALETLILILLLWPLFIFDWHSDFPLGMRGALAWMGMVCLPQFLTLLKTFPARQRSDFGRLSTLSKMTMLGGLLFVAVLYYYWIFS